MPIRRTHGRHRAVPVHASALSVLSKSMLSSAYAQIGVVQDCTRLVENALNAAGIPVGDLGPKQFMNYGTVVADPQPGDIVMQPGMSESTSATARSSAQD
ncbi:hypothetical protein [Pseudarthrobacter sp. R1]|uniref:hypothetical protein n=1 Tax=Pseudarthrobacter sp. R1 TaxID=2944934 RepID=UPI0027E266D8|nr:hypothetical protein [Pseudarthrobacter sp. R1]